MKKILGFIFLSFCIMWQIPAIAADDKGDDAKAVTDPYITINVPFTINFGQQSNKKANYLQIKVSIKSHDASTHRQVNNNMPMIKDTLRTLFSEQSYQNVSTVEGRKQLQADATKAINDALKTVTNNEGKVENVYFTSFILQ